MSGSDLQANITGRDNGASAAIDQSTKAMERLEKQTRKTNKETKDLQREISQNYKKSGEAVSKAGGSLGSVGGRVLGGIGMEGNIGRMAVGFAVASLAFSALNRVIEVGIAKTQMLIDARKQLNAAEDSAAKAKDAQALSGAGQAGAIRGIIAQGGSKAEGAIAILEKTGLATQQQIVSGMQTLFTALRSQGLRATGPESANALAEGVNLAEIGVPFDQAMAGLSHGDMRSDVAVRRRAIRMFGKQSGSYGEQAATDFYAAGKNITESPFLREADKTNAIMGGLPGIDRMSTTANGVGAARDQVAKATDPASAAMLALFKQNQQQLADLAELSKSQGTVMGFMADIFKPEGSFETQMRRIINAQAGAQFAPGR